MCCNWDKHLRGKFDPFSYLQVIESDHFQNNFKTSLTSKFARQRYLYVSLISSAIGPPGELQQRYSALWLVFLILLGHFSSPLLSELMHTSPWVPWQWLGGSNLGVQSGCQGFSVWPPIPVLSEEKHTAPIFSTCRPGYRFHNEGALVIGRTPLSSWVLFLSLYPQDVIISW